MKNQKDKRSEYFQGISCFFFEHRGSPFFLSSKELELIKKWEEMKIPLNVVCEGIQKTFENPRKKGRKIHSLAYCDYQVLKSFEQYRERQVGQKNKVENRDEKRKKVKNKIQEFLKYMPEELYFLKNIYTEGKRMLSSSNFEEQELEELDKKVRASLLAHIGIEERKNVRKNVLKDYNLTDEKQIERISRLALEKNLRDRYKIPYLSLFYY